MLPPPPSSTLFPYTTLFRSQCGSDGLRHHRLLLGITHFFDRGARFWRRRPGAVQNRAPRDRKSTRLNSSHITISYAVFCLKKKKKQDKLSETTSPARLQHNN